VNIKYTYSTFYIVHSSFKRRYIHYYDRLLQRSLVYQSVKLYLRCIVLDPVPYFTNIGK
jgi:hypothetical protein